LCEAYAFNYQQRYPQRVPGNAFLGCQAVMRHDFGRPMPSLFQAVAANPRAMGGFVFWNIRLLPSGAEAALFNATRTGDNPGYPPPAQHRTYAGVLALLLCLLIVAGGIELWRQRDYWRREWFATRAWSAGVLASAALGTLIVVLTERPWIDYMYALTVFVLLVAGLSMSALVRRFGIMRGTALAACALTVVLIAVLPSYYSRAPRPIHDAVDRVQVIRDQLQRQGSVLAAAQYGNEICNYLAHDYRHYCASVSWADLRGQVEAGVPLERVLERARVTAIYAEPALLADPLIAPLFASPGRAGWLLTAGGSAPDGPWRLLIRR
jgi:hypothetical protein